MLFVVQFEFARLVRWSKSRTLCCEYERLWGMQSIPVLFSRNQQYGAAFRIGKIFASVAEILKAFLSLIQAHVHDLIYRPKDTNESHRQNLVFPGPVPGLNCGYQTQSCLR